MPGVEKKPIRRNQGSLRFSIEHEKAPECNETRRIFSPQDIPDGLNPPLKQIFGDQSGASQFKEKSSPAPGL
jgi:hypothetical protein